MPRLPKGKGAAFDSLILAGVKVLTTLVGIVSTMILSRMLSLEAYGTYSQVNLVQSTVCSVTVLGLTDATNFFFNGRKEPERYISTITVFQLAVGLASAAAILLFDDAIAGYFDNSTLAGLLIYVAFRPYLNNVIASTQVLMVSLGKSRMLAVRNALISVVKIITVSITAFITQDIATILGVFFILDLLNAAWFMAVYSHEVSRPRLREASFRLLKEILSFSIPMGAFVFATSLFRETAKYIVGAFESTESFAVYSNCAAQLPLDFIAASFLTVLAPLLRKYIANGERAKACELYRQYLNVGFLTVLPFAVCLLIISEEAVLVLYGEKYISGVPVFSVYLFSYTISFVGSSLALAASGRTKTLMKISVCALVANLITCFLSYRLFGMLGTAVASAVVTGGMAVVVLGKSAEALGGSIPDIVDLKGLGVILLENLVLIVVCLFVREAMYVISVPKMGVAFVTVIVFLSLFYLMNYRKLKDCMRAINGME